MKKKKKVKRIRREGLEVVKNVPANAEDLREDPLEEGMATHSSILAWRMPGTEEPGELQSIGVAQSWT